MSDSISKRPLSVATVVAAVAAAIGVAALVGYVVGRDASDSPRVPRLGSEVAASAGAPVESPLAAPARIDPPAPTAAATPVAGERRPRAAAPAPASAPAATADLEVAPEGVAAPPPEPETDDAPAPGPAAPVPVPVEIPAGTSIQLALVAPVSSQVAKVGDRVEATLTAPIRRDGEIVVPSGTRVAGRVTEAKALAKVGGQARLALAFESLELERESVPIAAYWAGEGKSETGKDAATIAAGAAIGTVLGNQAKKNDRGKVIGAVVGAGVGTAVAAATKGEAVELAAGAALELTLRESVRVLPPR